MGNRDQSTGGIKQINQQEAEQQDEQDRYPKIKEPCEVQLQQEEVDAIMARAAQLQAGGGAVAPR